MSTARGTTPGVPITQPLIERLPALYQDGMFIEQFTAGLVPEKRVYGTGKQAQLRLITSTGNYDQAKGGFPRNLVVFADLAK